MILSYAATAVEFPSTCGRCFSGKPKALGVFSVSLTCKCGTAATSAAVYGPRAFTTFACENDPNPTIVPPRCWLGACRQLALFHSFGWLLETVEHILVADGQMEATQGIRQEEEEEEEKEREAMQEGDDAVDG